MATVEKLASGSWRAVGCIISDGKRIRKSFTVSPDKTSGDGRRARREALYLAEEWERAGIVEDMEGVSVSTAIEDYIRSREKVLSPSTVAGYIKLQRQLSVYDDLMNKPARQVTTSDIQPVINELSVALSPKTIKNRITFVLSALEYAGNDRRFKLTYPKRAKPEIRTPDSQDVKRLLDASGNDAELRAAIALAAFGTLRRGEVCALTQSDILRDMHSVSVTKDLVEGSDGVYHLKNIPKTVDSNRVVRLPAQVIALIPVGDPEDVVIHMTPVALSRRFERLAAKLGVSCSFHDLRHYAASFRSDLGIPAKYIEEAGGWSGESSVLKTVYDNPLRESRKKYNEMVNKYIEDTFGDILSA